jgi:soluble lytic murein transglycosylase-like protein
MGQTGGIGNAGALQRATAAGRTLPGWVGLASTRATPGQVQDAFETLLLSEILKPLEESLRGSGLFPEGAAGDIYSYFWKQQMGNLLAQQIDLVPGWGADATAGAAAGGAAGAALRGAGAAATSDQTSSRELAGAMNLSLPAAALQHLPQMPHLREPRSEPAPAASLRVTAPQTAEREAASAAAAAAPAAGDHPLLERLGPFENAIREAARVASVGANWLRAMIIQESGARPFALSRKGAQGLMQLLPATGRALGVRDPFDPVQNVKAGARYLASLVQRFGDIRLALAAYNAGPGRVEAYGGVPPFQETRDYVERVLALKEEFDQFAPEDGGLPLP